MKIELIPEGRTQIDRFSPFCHRSILTVLLPAKHRLSDLLEDWRLFTLAVPELLGLPDLLDLAVNSGCVALPSPTKVKLLALMHPLFVGLTKEGPRLNYNSYLWLVPREHAYNLAGWLGTLAFTGDRAGRLYRIRTQAIDAYDTTGEGGLAWDVNAKPVPVVAAIAEVAGGVFSFERYTAGFSAVRWRADFRPLDNPETAQFEQALKQEDPNPYGADIPLPKPLGEADAQ